MVGVGERIKMMVFRGIDLGVWMYVRRGKWVFLEYSPLLAHCSGYGRFSSGLVNWISSVHRVKSKNPHKMSVRNEIETENGEDYCIQMEPVKV